MSLDASTKFTVIGAAMMIVGIISLSNGQGVVRIVLATILMAAGVACALHAHRLRQAADPKN